MKKVMVYGIVLCLALAISGCSTDNTQQNSSTTSSNLTTFPTTKSLEDNSSNITQIGDKESTNPTTTNAADSLGIGCSLDLQDHNTIDDYFHMMSEKNIPTTTYEMLMFDTIISEAWKEEMMNCYEDLKSKTSEGKIHKLLNSERNSYIKYIENKAEIYLYYASGAFNEGFTLGSLSSVDSVDILSEGYKEKTIELMGRLEDIGDKPTFIFDRKKFNKKLKKEFFKDHPNAFE